jgi:hypothetical protein
MRAMSKHLSHKNTLINLILPLLDLDVFLQIIDDLTDKAYQRESGRFVAEFINI